MDGGVDLGLVGVREKRFDASEFGQQYIICLGRVVGGVKGRNLADDGRESGEVRGCGLSGGHRDWLSGCRAWLGERLRGRIGRRGGWSWLGWQGLSILVG